MFVFVAVPVVSSVDGVDNVRLNQTGVLLTLPAPRGPTCATRGNRHRRWGQSDKAVKKALAAVAARE